MQRLSRSCFSGGEPGRLRGDGGASASLSAFLPPPPPQHPPQQQPLLPLEKLRPNPAGSQPWGKGRETSSPSTRVSFPRNEGGTGGDDRERGFGASVPQEPNPGGRESRWWEKGTMTTTPPPRNAVPPLLPPLPSPQPLTSSTQRRLFSPQKSPFTGPPPDPRGGSFHPSRSPSFSSSAANLSPSPVFFIKAFI